MHRRASLLAAVAAAVVLLSTPGWAQDAKAFEKNLTVHKLKNGLTVLIYHRPVAPVFSFFTHVDVGGAQEVPGITGLAHMFEHMAFKGTSVIGTKDYAGEKVALAKVDEAYLAYDVARRKPGGSNPASLDTLKKAWKDAQDAADKFIEKNEFSMIVDREGGVGMNASTNSDETSCGPTSSRPASSTRCSASSTRSATSSWKSGGCARRARRRAACSSSSSRRRSSRTPTSSRWSAT
jgi:hypothetical protein